MSHGKDAWADFQRWNDHLADVVYPQLEYAAPVYLDLEDEQCSALGARGNIPATEVIETLASVVTATSDTTSGHAFRPHMLRLGRWRATADPATPPPILPLLAVFSLAAERMAADVTMSAHNYYGRLAELIPMDRERLAKSYQEVAEAAWGALNRWLTDLGGARGNPTAYSVGMRYVGLSVSQALVRETDRLRLRDFFVHFGFTPGSHLAPLELEAYLDAWISSAQPSPAGANLSRLWERNGLRARIAEIVSTELEEWDGAGASADAIGKRRSPVLLTLGLPSFSRRSVELTPLFYTGAPDEIQLAYLASPSGEVEVELVPAGEGASTLAAGDRLGNLDALEGVVQLRVAGQTLERQPKRMVVFKQSEFSRRWVETDQVLLGDDLKALVNSAFAPEVRAALNEVARPGWLEQSDLDGLPTGWILISDLEVFTRPMAAANKITELGALLPMTSSQLKIEGGLRIPGRIRGRWHTEWPPEVRAISDGGAPFSLALTRSGDASVETTEIQVMSWEDAGLGSIVVDLGEFHLEDGEYQLEMTREGSVLLRKGFALLSTSSSDPERWSEIVTVLHDLANPLATLGVDDSPVGTPGIPLQVVLDVDVEFGDASSLTPPDEPWWTSERSVERRSTVHLARPVEGSCFYTGRHHEVLPRAESDSRGRPIAQIMVGRCKFCGLERRYSTDYYRNRREFERAEARRLNQPGVVKVADLRHLVNVREVDNFAMWNAVLDTLRVIGGGDGQSLEFLARQLDSGSLFFASFVRVLENLGHIEVRRDPKTREVSAWAIGATLILRSAASARLAGFWTPDLQVALLAIDSGASLDASPSNNGPEQMLVDADDLERLIEDAEIGVALVERPGWMLASHLPTISAVVDALPLREMPQIGLQWFDVMTASWRDVVETGKVGAYRTSGYSRTYLYRSKSHVAEGSAVEAGHAFVKHAAARELAGRPYLSYDVSNSKMITPIGAELPGLYERAITLETGNLGVVRKNFVIYEDVPPDLAARLAFLLTSD